LRGENAIGQMLEKRTDEIRVEKYDEFPIDYTMSAYSIYNPI
jgi:hypothetical protein